MNYPQQYKHPSLEAAVLLLTGLTSTLCFSQDFVPELPSYITSSVIEGNALSNIHGILAVNVAAGDSNAQLNAVALAVGLEGGFATAQVNLQQAVGWVRATAPNLSIAIIRDHAFANSLGTISVNQTSGVGNTQVNGLAIAVGFVVEAVSESKLAATASGVGLEGQAKSINLKAASIANTAFEGSRGIVQVNQSAGSGNSTANNFAFHLQLETKP